MQALEKQIQSILSSLYPPEEAGKAAGLLVRWIDEARSLSPNRIPDPGWSSRDIVLVTYADTLSRKGQYPLQTLSEFLMSRCEDIVSTIHVLPFFPYSSDDGFAVEDFSSVNPPLGSWRHIERLSQNFRIMADLVLNHVSSRSGWFASYLKGEEGFQNLAIEVSPQADLSRIVRPRETSLLTPFVKADGTRVHLWTTFGPDQVDLNYQSPDVLLKMMDVLFLYLRHGISMFRLDAVAYLWKCSGSAGIHLKETHALIKLIRLIVTAVRKDAILVTETNVPHEENIQYFGDGEDEAHLVYNFTLPPLLLHAFIYGDTRTLSRWASTLRTLSGHTTFLNFTASHDGIGVRPLEGIVEPDELRRIIRRIRENGGKISYRRDFNGNRVPYELNITYIDALNGPETRNEADLARRFLASQSVPLILPGIPAVYIHSLLGSRNWLEGVRQRGIARAINREKLDMDEVNQATQCSDSFRFRVFQGLSKMLRTRREQPALDPQASCEVLKIDPRLFAVRRSCPQQTLLAVVNVTYQNWITSLPADGISQKGFCVLNKKTIDMNRVEIGPHEIFWIQPGCLEENSNEK